MQVLVFVLITAAAATIGLVANNILVRRYDPEGIEARKERMRREGEREGRERTRTARLRELGDRAMSLRLISDDRETELAKRIRRAGWNMTTGTFVAITMTSGTIGAAIGVLATLRLRVQPAGGASSAGADGIGAVLQGLSASVMAIGAHVAVFAICTAIGLLVPRILMRFATRRRRALIEATLPGNLELLSVVVGAGQTIESGIKTIAKRTSGPIAEEFMQVSNDITYYGKTTPKALEDMAERCKVQEMSLFVGAMNQSMRAGSPISEILKSQARLASERYYQQIEEKSNKIRTKMIFPMVFFLLPPVFLVSVGPTVIRALSELPKMM